MKEQILPILTEQVAHVLREKDLIKVIAERKELPTFIENPVEKGYMLDYSTLRCDYLAEDKEGVLYTLQNARWYLESRLLMKHGQAGGGNRPGTYYTGAINSAVVEIKYDEESGEPIISIIELDVSTDYMSKSR